MFPNKAHLYSLLLAVIIFLIPSNLFLKLSIENAYVSGLLVDYLIPKLYLSDVFIIFFVILFGLGKIKNYFNKKTNLHVPLIGILSLTFILITRQLFTSNPTSALYYTSRLVLLVLFINIAISNKNLLSKKVVFQSLTGTVIFQSIVSLYQFITQKTIYGFLFLGETNIQHPYGIPNAVLFGAERILPHGTTPHPNILGGVIVIFLLLATSIFYKEKNKEKFSLKQLQFFWSILATSWIVGLVTLFLTQSISAWFTLLLGGTTIFLLEKYQKKRSLKIQKITSIILLAFIILTSILIIPTIAYTSRIYPDNPSLSRRSMLNNAAVAMIRNNPVWGIGLNNFTMTLDEYGINSERVRFVQPVHHVGLLWMSETGIIGVVLLAFIIHLLFKKKKQIIFFVIPLVPIALLDHYLLSTQSGLLVCSIGIILLWDGGNQLHFKNNEDHHNS